MLPFYDEYLLRCIAKETTVKYLREAETERLVMTSGLPRTNWLPPQARKKLHDLGHAFTLLGQRLNGTEARSV